jgi:hypothetical protein
MRWDTRIPGKTYGSEAEQGIWRIKNNQQLRELYRIIDLEMYIKRRRLELLGYVIKTGQTRTAKKILIVSQKVDENTKTQAEIVGRCRE